MINPTPTPTWALAHHWRERLSHRFGGQKAGGPISHPARVIFQSCHSGKVWHLPLVTTCSLEKGARSLGKAPYCPPVKPTNRTHKDPPCFLLLLSVGRNQKVAVRRVLLFSHNFGCPCYSPKRRNPSHHLS